MSLKLRATKGSDVYFQPTDFKLTWNIFKILSCNLHSYSNYAANWLGQRFHNNPFIVIINFKNVDLILLTSTTRTWPGWSHDNGTSRSLQQRCLRISYNLHTVLNGVSLFWIKQLIFQVSGASKFDYFVQNRVSFNDNLSLFTGVLFIIQWTVQPWLFWWTSLRLRGLHVLRGKFMLGNQQISLTVPVFSLCSDK